MAISSIRDLFSRRWTVVRAMFGTRWKRAVSWFWFGLGVWDLALSQVVPAEMAQKFPKFYQAIEISTGFLSLSGWLTGAALLIALFSVEYAYRHTRKMAIAGPSAGDPPAVSKEKIRPTIAPAALTASLRGASTSTALPSVKTDASSSNPPAAKVVPPPGPELMSKTMPGWEKLYLIAKDGSITLHFLPDTKKKMGDALCLILLAHKLHYGQDKVSVAIIENELRQSMRNKPKSPLETAFGLQFMAVELATNISIEAVEGGKVERIELAKGGSYAFTWWGEAEALGTAQDMIRRA